jgi:hypothetical protein
MAKRSKDWKEDLAEDLKDPADSSGHTDSASASLRSSPARMAREMGENGELATRNTGQNGECVGVPTKRVNMRP